MHMKGADECGSAGLQKGEKPKAVKNLHKTSTRSAAITFSLFIKLAVGAFVGWVASFVE